MRVCGQVGVLHRGSGGSCDRLKRPEVAALPLSICSTVGGVPCVCAASAGRSAARASPSSTHRARLAISSSLSRLPSGGISRPVVLHRLDQQAFCRLARHRRRPALAPFQHRLARGQRKAALGLLARRRGTCSSAESAAGEFRARKTRRLRGDRCGSSLRRDAARQHPSACHASTVHMILRHRKPSTLV